MVPSKRVTSWEGHILVDHRNRVDKRHAVDLLAGLAVEQHLSLPWLIQSGHEAQHRALATAGRTYQGDALTSLDLQREMFEDRWQVAVVAEGDVAQLYLACQFGGGRHILYHSLTHP